MEGISLPGPEGCVKERETSPGRGSGGHRESIKKKARRDLGTGRDCREPPGGCEAMEGRLYSVSILVSLPGSLLAQTPCVPSLLLFWFVPLF